MSYPPGPYGGSPEWQGQQPGWQPPQPGWPAQRPGYAPEPDNYLIWAILTTLFCCLPLGIVSIVYSSKVSGLWAQGRYAEAQAASASARKWAIISAIGGVVVAVAFAVIYIALILVAVSVDHNTPSTITTYSDF